MGAQRRLMVVGAMPGNLGSMVYEEALKSREWEQAKRYDINGNLPGIPGSPSYLDLTNRRQVIEALENFSPTDIVCTVGVNHTEANEATIADSVRLHWNANVNGPMQLLTEALDLWKRWRWREPKAVPDTGFNFCSISSNSAHLARSQSAGYCASKAGLSMALRCVARRVAMNPQLCIWGYEPGFLVGTPMSERTAEAFPTAPLHRIPGGYGLDPHDLADRIVGDLIVASRSLNGCMMRIDGGEQ